MNLLELTDDQFQATIVALDERVQGLMGQMHESLDADFLDATGLQQRMDNDLRLLRPTLAGLKKADSALADRRLAELTALVADYRQTLARRQRDEAEVDEWNTRVEAQRKTVAQVATAS